MPELAVTPLTPPRAGGIAALVLWGRRAGATMRELFPGIAPGRPTFRRLVDEGGVVDEVIALLLGDETAGGGREEGEITFHGGRVAHEAALAFFGRRGAGIRPVDRYLELSSRYDRIQVEALLALPRARTALQTAFLLRNAGGELSREIERIAAGGAPSAREAAEALVERARLGLSLARGARVLVAGPPNAGKSTLVNRLCGAERSIVTEIAGTTRDVLEAPFEVEGIPVVLIDGGGIVSTGSPLERRAAEKVLSEARRADVVLCLGIEPAGLVAPVSRAIRLGPKADTGASYGPGVLPVSGLTGLGVPELLAAIAAELRCGGDWRRPAPFTDRHVALLEEALALADEKGDAACRGAMSRLL